MELYKLTMKQNNIMVNDVIVTFLPTCIVMLFLCAFIYVKQFGVQNSGDGPRLEYKGGDIYNADTEDSNYAFTQPMARAPLKPQPFLLLETPFLQNLR